MIALFFSAVLALGDGRVSLNERPDTLAHGVVKSGIRLTYLCANRFRIRSMRRDTVRVRWSVDNSSDTGSVLIPDMGRSGRPRDGSFETTATGITRVFVGELLADSVAHGSAPCLPQVPEYLGYPDDSTYQVVDSATARPVVYFRRIATVDLLETLTNEEVSAFLRQYRARVLSGLSNERVYIVQLPDLGASVAAMWRRIDQMFADRRVMSVSPASRQGVFVNITPMHRPR
jgi:hypothetical protein